MAISVDTRYRHCAALQMSTTFLRNLLSMSLEPTNVYGVTARQTVMWVYLWLLRVLIPLCMTYDQCTVWQLYQLMYAHKEDKQVQVLTWKRVRDGLGIGLDTGLGIGLGAGLRSLPPLPRRGSTNRPLSGTTGCWGTAALRSRVSHVSEILRDVLLIIRPLPGVPVAGPSSTVSSSSRAATSLRAQYSLISATKARYWSRVLLSSCT
jgi:hypothetical protein